MPQEGLLVQLDGSRHDWLEGRGPWLTLVGAIDDATGIGPAATFPDQGDVAGYLKLLRMIVRRKGITGRGLPRSPRHLRPVTEPIRGREPGDWASVDGLPVSGSARNSRPDRCDQRPGRQHLAHPRMWGLLWGFSTGMQGAAGPRYPFLRYTA